MTAENNPADAKRKDAAGVLCAKCDHLNPPGSTECEHCHSALFRDCPKCGKTVQRVFSRCNHCGASLARWGKNPGHVHPAARPFNMWWVYAAVLAACLMVCYIIFNKVGNMNLGH